MAGIQARSRAAAGPNFEESGLRVRRSGSIAERALELRDVESRYQRNPDLLAVDMDGDLVMMSIERGNYYGVGGIGPHLWRLLEAPRSRAELVDEICREFEVDEATAGADLERFIADLAAHGLVTVS